jgi:hypothetical protein
MISQRCIPAVPPLVATVPGPGLSHDVERHRPEQACRRGRPFATQQPVPEGPDQDSAPTQPQNEDPVRRELAIDLLPLSHDETRDTIPSPPPDEDWSKVAPGRRPALEPE